MTPTRTALDALNRDYLEMRSRLLDLAAALDRIDAARDAQAVARDERMAKLIEGLRILGDGKADRAERVQRVFSQPYEQGWLTHWRMPSNC